MRNNRFRCWPAALILLIILTLLPSPVLAEGGSLSLKIRSGPFVPNEEFRIVVSVSGDTPDLACFGPLRITFDTSLFTYTRSELLNGDVEFKSDVSANTVTLTGYSESGGGVTISGDTYLAGVYFKAKTTGTGTFAISHVEGFASIDQPTEEISLAINNSLTVTVTAPVPKSDDNTLKSLTIDPGTLNPAFSAGQTSYTTQVPEGVSKLTVSAVASDSKASVAVSGNSSLQDGDNTIKIVVTAENGDKKTYTILATRNGPSPTPEPSPSPTPTPPVTIQLGQGSFTVGEPPSGTPIPTGFYQSIISLDGQVVPAFKSLGDDQTLLYLTDEDGSGGFYYYNPETQAYEPPLDESARLPEGFEAKDLFLDGVSLTAWQKLSGSGSGGNEEDQYLLYLMDSQGNKKFYLYSLSSKLLVPYEAAGTTETSVAPDISATVAPQDNSGLSAELNTWQLAAAVLGILCLILTGLVIWLANRARRDRGPVRVADADFYEYDDEGRDAASLESDEKDDDDHQPPLKIPPIRRVD